MPAPVPPGYTRGPILFLHLSSEPTTEQGQLQWLWREAGGYGARLVLVAVDATQRGRMAQLHALLAEWECDRLEQIEVLDRASARNMEHVERVQQATGIILLGTHPSRLATTLGGTPLAQAIRRANARSKLVAGIDAAGAFLCQHMITPGATPATLGGTVAFGPGLGLVNRLVVDANGTPADKTDNAERRLLAAVASNPFLIGVRLVAGSAAILYPDNTLQSNGSTGIVIVDGEEIMAVNWEGSNVDEIEGGICHTLHAGDGFNLDDHTLRPLGEIDLPPTGPVTSVF